MKIITAINRMYAYVRTSAEDDNFLSEGGGCVYLMILFNLRVFVFVCQIYSIIPGNFGFARY